MKRRMLVIAMTLMMVAAMIPSMAFAADSAAVAAIGETEYDSLFDAVEAAKEGETIKLLQDFTINVTEKTVYDMPKGSTLDLNGKTLTIPYSSSPLACAMFVGENVTIKNGTITPPANKNQDYALYIGNAVNANDERIPTSITISGVNVDKGGINVRYGANVTIEDTDVKVNPNRKYYAVYASADTKVIIKSGTFTGGRNAKDVYEASEGNIDIYGGTYANKLDEKYVAEDQTLVENEDGTWTVIAPTPDVPDDGGDVVEPTDPTDPSTPQEPTEEPKEPTAPTAPTDTEKKDTAVQTSDDFNMAIPFALAGFALAGMAVAVVTRKRYN